MKVSVCLSTYNRAPAVLDRVLESICRQKPPFDYEVVVVDDGTKRDTARRVCEKYPVEYIRIERSSERRNPCIARNVAYRAATGDVIVAQSDDVVHVSPNAIATLVRDLEQNTCSFVIATVYGCGPDGRTWSVYSGQQRKVPYFFLGALWRSDLYAIGGNDESFEDNPGYDDHFFAECLTEGLGLQPYYSSDVIGHHLYHPSVCTEKQAAINKQIGAELEAKCRRTGVWCATGGPWPYDGDGTGPDPTERAFTRAYFSKYWSKGQSVSGEGSSIDAARSLIVEIPRLLKVIGAESLLDVPCGDYCWASRMELNGVQYTGGDIVAPLIESNRMQYPDRDFRRIDLVRDPLPRADVVLCRDCLVHLSIDDCFRALKNVKQSGARYLLATTFFNHRDNRDNGTGPDWAPRCLTAPPFNLPPPRAVIDELCKEVYPKFYDKGLALWATDYL